jgi:hypothetical protein
MNRKSLTAALALAALGLAACNDRTDRINSGICWNFNPGNGQTAATPIASSNAASPVEDCMRRWAYSLAGSRDPADTVANAVVSACGATLTRWNQAALAQESQDTSGGEAVSLTTGQPTTPLAAHAAFAQGRALLYVVEARAGNCAPPPVTNGYPAGTQAP